MLCLPHPAHFRNNSPEVNRSAGKFVAGKICSKMPGIPVTQNTRGSRLSILDYGSQSNIIGAMTGNKPHCLYGETLITLAEAAADFGGVPVPVNTVKKYTYQGVGGLKLESVSINGRYTSREAIDRFIERKQNLDRPLEKPRVKPMTTSEIEAGLRRHGLVK